MTEPYLSLGLCSVTLRALPIEEVVAVAAGAGLECIEWGGDVHVPPGDLGAARRAREATERAGLRVASYGSYWRCAGDFGPELASARELGAPRMRIWAGEVGSAEATTAERAGVVAAARALATAAAGPTGATAGGARGATTGTAAVGEGIGLAFEFHGGTLTDDIDPALALIEASGVPSYWQPPQGMQPDVALDGLRRLPHVPAVHVFSWWPGSTRRRLHERRRLWQAVFATFTSGDALLEFVPGDDPSLVAEEAKELRHVAR